jgi:predicted DNA-binding protein
MTNTRISKQIGVRIPNEMHDALAALAKRERRSVGFMIRDFVEEGMQRANAGKKSAAKATVAKRRA